MRDLGERQIGNGCSGRGTHLCAGFIKPSARCFPAPTERLWWLPAPLPWEGAEHELRGRPGSKRPFPSGLWIKGLSHPSPEPAEGALVHCVNSPAGLPSGAPRIPRSFPRWDGPQARLALGGSQIPLCPRMLFMIHTEPNHKTGARKPSVRSSISFLHIPDLKASVKCQLSIPSLFTRPAWLAP